MPQMYEKKITKPFYQRLLTYSYIFGMRIRTLSLMSAVILSVLLSCSKKPEIQIREVDYLNKSRELLKSVPVDMDMPMLTYGVIHCDSLNILMTQDPRGYVFVYSDDWKLLGTFCQQGRAQYEFLDRPRHIKNQVLLGEDGHLLLPLQDATTIKVVDITASLISHKAVISETRDYAPYTDIDIMIGDSPARLRTMNKYMFLDNDIYKTLELTEGFSFDFGDANAQYKIRHDTAYVEVPGILHDMEKLTGPQPEGKFSREFFKHPSRNLVIEPFMVLDYIMFYDLEGNRSFAIHQTGSLTWNEDPVEVPHYDDQGEFDYFTEERGCFGDAVATDSYFLVFYFGGDYSLADENKDWPRPELLLFDWDGNFRKSVMLDTYIDCAAFDEKNKILYGVPIEEPENEVLLSYDLSSLFR